MHADEVLCANVHPKSIELTIVAKNVTIAIVLTLQEVPL